MRPIPRRMDTCEIQVCPMLPEKSLSVWILVQGEGSQRYFFENDVGQPVQALYVDGYQYLRLKLDDMDTNDIWFQQKGATGHRTHATLINQQERFERMVITRVDAVNWPPRTCDLIPLNFLWGTFHSRSSMRINHSPYRISKTI